MKFFYENHPPTRHIKYKRIDFVPCNKSIMANKLPTTNLERFLRQIKSPLTRVNCPKLAKMAFFNPHNFMKNDNR